MTKTEALNTVRDMINYILERCPSKFENINFMDLWEVLTSMQGDKDIPALFIPNISYSHLHGVINITDSTVHKYSVANRPVGFIINK